jgi:hypothetical protein
MNQSPPLQIESAPMLPASSSDYPGAPSIYLLIDRESRLAGITILAGRLDNLRSASVTRTAWASGIGTSATATGAVAIRRHASDQRVTANVPSASSRQAPCRRSPRAFS